MARLPCSMPFVRRLIPALATAVVLGAVAVAGADTKQIRELGVDNGAPLPAPACPAKPCAALNQVTGYQVQISKAKNPYLMTRKGRIVAFTIRLSKPNAAELKYFRANFGAKPKARLSILRLGHRNREAKLVAQSGTFDLSKYLGSTPTFALNKSLRVGPRSVVALTVPTWAPAFAINLGRGQAWRASRPSSECDGDPPPPNVHSRIGAVRRYGCFYRRARVLYSATFVPDPKPTTK